MMRKLSILVAVVLVGCSQSPSKEQTEAAKTVQETRQWAEKVSEGIDKTKAKEEALKKDRNAIVQKAVEAMRKAAAENFGTASAQQAEITADQSGIKDFGEENWEVTGQYVGPDDDGKKFRAPWTAKISIMFGSLQCQSIKLGKRTP